MEGTVLQRLDLLETRVATLEQLLAEPRPDRPGVPTDPVAPVEPPVSQPTTPPPSPQPIAEAAPPTAAEHAEQPAARPPTRRGRTRPDAATAPARHFDYEQFFGLAVLGRIGVAAVVLAGAYFAQLGWGNLGPGARVVAVYLTAALMIGTGAWLFARVAPRYVALLWGGGTSLAYLAGVTAKLRYDLIGTGPALFLLVASAALGQLLARRLRLQPMATIALGGAYAAPLLVGMSADSPTVLFTYLLTLHAWSAFIEHEWNWHLPRRLAVTATVVLACHWFATHPEPTPLTVLLHVEAVWLLLMAPELGTALLRGTMSMSRWRLVGASGWAVQLLLLAWMLSRDAAPGFGLVAGTIGLGLGAALLRRQPTLLAPAAILSRLSGTLLVLGAFLWWNSNHVPPTAGIDQPVARVLSVVLCGVALLAARRFTAAADFATAIAAGLGLWVIAMPTPAGEGRALAAAVLLLPTGLVLFGKHAFSTRTGLFLGTAITFVAVRLDATFDPPVQLWLPIAVGAAGLWQACVGVVAGHRRDRALQAATSALLAIARVALPVFGAALVPLLRAHGATIGAVPKAGLATGAMALLGSALLARRAPGLRAGAIALADLGALLLAIGALAVFGDNATALQAFDQPWPRLLSLTAVSLGVLALRRWILGGELGVLLAAAVGCALTVLPEPTAALRAQTGAMLVVPAVLVLTGRAALVRCTALALAAIALFFASTHQFTFQGDHGFWLSVAFGSSGAAAALGALRAGWRNDRPLLITSTALLAVLGIAWSIAAFLPAEPGTAGLPAFVNVRFLSAAAILLLLDFGRRRLPGGASAVDRVVFAAIEFAVLYLAGLVEMLAVVQTWPPGWSAVTISLYTLLFAGALLAAGFVRRQSWLRWPGLCGFAIVVVKVALFDLSDLATPLRVLVTGVLGLVLLLGAFGYARLRRSAAPGP